jgi:hypothetical protein
MSCAIVPPLGADAGSGSSAVAGAVNSLAALYDDPEVRSERVYHLPALG